MMIPRFVRRWIRTIASRSGVGPTWYDDVHDHGIIGYMILKPWEQMLLDRHPLLPFDYALSCVHSNYGTVAGFPTEEIPHYHSLNISSRRDHRITLSVYDGNICCVYSMDYMKTSPERLKLATPLPENCASSHVEFRYEVPLADPQSIAMMEKHLLETMDQMIHDFRFPIHYLHA